MRRDEWLNLVRILNLPSCCCPHFGLLSQRHGVSEDTLCSIYSQENQRRIVQSSQMFQQQAPQIHKQYLNGVDFMHLCTSYNWPACFLVRRLLELPPFCLGKQRTTEVMRSPELILEARLRDEDPADSGEKQKKRMLADINTAISCDPSNSPAADLKRRELGLRYEEILSERLNALGVSFWTEEALRAKGYVKTPDAKLQVPFMYAGQIVSWIDSKACFGGEYMHQEQSQAQYQKYVNRYGSGMVVYWFDVIDDLRKASKDVIATSDVPEAAQCVFLPQLPVEKLTASTLPFEIQ